MTPQTIFTSHPRSIGESYGQHLVSATGFGLTMLWAGLACLVHAIFPFLFTATARVAVQTLHRRIVTHRDRRSEAARTA